MKKIELVIRPRGDGKYYLRTWFNWGWTSHKQTGLTEEELIKEVTEQIKGAISEWNRR